MSQTLMRITTTLTRTLTKGIDMHPKYMRHNRQAVITKLTSKSIACGMGRIEKETLMKAMEASRIANARLVEVLENFTHDKPDLAALAQGITTALEAVRRNTVKIYTRL